MTRREIERAVAWWIPRLGLASWDITVCWDGWDREDSSHASVWRSNDYELARLYFNPADYSTWSTVDGHRYIVHELLHLVTREVEQVLELIDGHLHRDVDAILRAAHTHAVEGAVDRLAYRIVALAGAEG